MKTMNAAAGAMRRRTLLAGAILASTLGCASTAAAGPVDLAVVDRETGRELPVWRSHGRSFVAGQPGARYGLRVSNHTGGRVLVVLSVDGVNVLDGRTARYDQGGYVLDPYESYDVTGWRKSQAEVAAFTFAALPQSYAARTGRPGDVGVLGMAVFQERAPVAYVAPPEDRWERQAPSRGAPGLADAAPPPPLPLPAVKAPLPESSGLTAQQESRAPSAEAYAARRRDDKLGTAHGAREWSSVSFTDFVRATTTPQSVQRIEYDTYPNLVARGVVRPYPYAEHRPRPFPLEPGRGGFVPDPPPYDR